MCIRDSPNALSYDVWRTTSTYEGCTSTLEFTPVKIGVPPDTYDPVQYEDWEGIEALETYCYTVQAFGPGENNWAFSESPVASTSYDCADMDPFYPPTITINFATSTVDYSVVSLSWTDCQNENEYEVWRRLVGEGFAYVDTVGSSTDANVHYVDYTVEEDNTYEYLIKAWNTHGDTDSNPSEQIYVPIAPPGGFTLTGQWVSNKTEIELTWTEAASTTAGGEVTYTVLKDDSEDFEDATIICSTVGLEYRDDDPISGKPWYKVVATNNGGSTDSNVINMYSFPFPIWIEVIPQ